MSAEDKFNAAVNVIRSLPKNGSYQPSHEMMLRFYGYFKQATQGACDQPKPGFWDVINKAKWGAWKKLGNMPSEEAMEAYVNELQKIVETMSYTDNVASFLGNFHELDGVHMGDLDLVAPEAMFRVRSNPNSPLVSREASPQRVPIINENFSTNIPADSVSNPYTPDHSDDEYSDTVENEKELLLKHSLTNGHISSSESTYSSNHASRSRDKRFEFKSDPELLQLKSPNKYQINDSEVGYKYAITVCEQLNKTVQILQSDLQKANDRVILLEKALSVKQEQKTTVAHWWPLVGITPNWFIFLIFWPFVAQRISMLFFSRKRY